MPGTQFTEVTVNG